MGEDRANTNTHTHTPVCFLPVERLDPEGHQAQAGLGRLGD